MWVNAGGAGVERVLHCFSSLFGSKYLMQEACVCVFFRGVKGVGVCESTAYSVSKICYKSFVRLKGLTKWCNSYC